MNKYLLQIVQKVFGLLAVVLLAVSCSGGGGLASKGITITLSDPEIFLGHTNILTVTYVGFTENDDKYIVLSNRSPNLITLPDTYDTVERGDNSVLFRVVATTNTNAKGYAGVSATAGGYTATTAMRVVHGFIGVEILTKNIILPVGGVTNIYWKGAPRDADHPEVFWFSSNPAVAVLNRKETIHLPVKVKGVSPGTSTITLSNISGVTDTTTVTVYQGAQLSVPTSSDDSPQ